MSELSTILVVPPENAMLQGREAASLVLPAQRQLFDSRLEALQAEHPERGASYAATMHGLFDEIPGAEWLFPDGLRHLATAATRGLVLGSIDTLRAHFAAAEQTAGKLSLRSGWELPYDFHGTDPLKRLEHLRLAYWMAGQVRSNPDIAAVQVMSGKGYAKWRFVDTSGRLPSCATLHVRPLGSENYDPKFEYGKRDYGVEASEAFTVDTGLLQAWFQGDNRPGLPDIAKQRGSNTQVTIRSDREGGDPSDPNRRADDSNGRRVQDVGSILNKRGQVDPGLLLAVGNPKTLNHTPVFPDEEGQVEVFANRSRALIVRATERSASLVDLHNVQRRSWRTARKPARGFAAFALGENPYDMSGVRSLAHAAGIELGALPTDAELQRLFDVFGKETIFRSNVERFTESTGGLSQRALAAIIEKTGVLSPIPLRTIYSPRQERAIATGVIFPGTLGWTERRVGKLMALRRQGVHIGQVLLAATRRPLDSPTELAHPDVVALQRKLTSRRMPTDIDYMRHVATPRLVSAGLKVGDLITLPFETATPDGPLRRQTARDLAGAVAAAHPEIADGPVLQTVNQPAGYTAFGVLTAFAETLSNFSPEQFYVASGGNRVAQTPDELRLGLFQNTYTAPSSVVRWVHALHQLNTVFA